MLKTLFQKCNRPNIQVLKDVYKVFNNIFEIGHFPDIFKTGHITALYKNSGLKSNKENYRGIHLLPTLSKIAESVIHSRLLGHVITNNVKSFLKLL